MSVIQVQGLLPLRGEIKIQGSKNAVLPMMAASILHKGKTVINNVPRIQDLFCMMGILETLGCKCSLEGHQLVIDAENLNTFCISKEDMGKMRSSIFLMGPLLARVGEALTYYPGGCSIGGRPIDLHLLALKQLGATITEDNGKITAKAAKLKGNHFHFSFPSVGATENAVMAAVLAEGDTLLTGCAIEPEIGELCHFLVNMGASIEGIGSSTLVIRGDLKLGDSSYYVGGDRIAAGTFLAAAVITGGRITVDGADPGNMHAELSMFEKMGARITREGEHAITIKAAERPIAASVMTNPYPGFPTDLQSPIMAALAVAGGDSWIEENIFEGRFKTAGELTKMGANITVKENRAYVTGIHPLQGGKIVEAMDLRGGAALVLAGLGAEGTTRITQCHHIDRGYEDICRDLRLLGARVTQTEL